MAATLMYTGVLWSVGANNIIALEIMMRNAVKMISNLISFIVVIISDYSSLDLHIFPGRCCLT